MKRLAYIFISFCMIAFCGCQKKKERLSAPTVTLQISPSVARVTANGQKTFTATVLSPNGAVLNVEPTWKLSSDTLGQLLPDTGAQTIFYAGQGLGISGTLQATYNDLTATAQIAVGADTGNSATAYGFYTESLPNIMKFDTSNPPDVNGGFLGIYTASGGGATLEPVTQAGLFTEGTKALKITVTGDASSDVAIYFSYGFPNLDDIKGPDMSAFANGRLKFDIRAPAGNLIDAKLEWVGLLPGASRPITTYTTFDDQFHSVSIPISAFTGVDLTQFEGVTFVINHPNAAGTFIFYIDNLRFER